METQTRQLVVALDTSIIEKANYFFNGQDLGILKQHVLNGNISHLLISDIAVREAKRHFREYGDKIHDRLKPIFDLREWKTMSVLDGSSKVLGCLDKEKMALGMDALLDKYLADTHAIILDSESVKLEDIVTDFFNSVPPFRGKEKKHEFPDAIMIAKIKQLIPEYVEICVVADDSDWEAAFWKVSGIRFFKDFKALFDFITKELEISHKAINYYNENAAIINSQIEDILYEKPYSVDGYEYDRKGIIGGTEYNDTEVRNLTIKSKFNNVDFIDENEVIATVLVQAVFEIECSFIDEEDSIWDSEEKEYISPSYKSVTEIHALDFYTTIKFKLENEEITDVNEVMPETEDTLRFDMESRFRRKYKSHEGDIEYSKSYTCPNCNHRMTIDIMEHAEFVAGYERKMGAESEYDVSYEDNCAHCGQAFRISGKLYEYPVGALNLDDTKIEWKK